MDINDLIENADGSVEIPMDPATAMPVPEEFLANLAEIFDSGLVRGLADDLADLIEKDAESRKKRDKQYEEGLRRTGLGDDAPGGAEFDGASKVVHPVLAESCVDFSARAIKELFPATGPVRRQQFQDVVPPDILAKADKKVEYMNWQLTTQMPEYRPTLEQLLTQLPMGGSQYQKFWYDERFKRPKVEFVPVDEILLPFAASSFYTASRVTHRQLVTKQEFGERVKSGLYRDIFVPIPGSVPDRTDTAKANDKIEGREEDGYNEDGLRAILEIYTWQVIDEDEISGGGYAPYIITVDEDTRECLAIYRNWAEGDATLQKLDWMVEWIFIPWRGAYGIGLPHLIGGLSAALTGSLRALLDSAHINNAATMLKLKSGRVVGQNTEVNVTQICDIEAPAGVDDIRKIAMAMPFNPPSPVLFQLMGNLYELAKSVVATADEKLAQVGDRTPVGTTMSLIEQGSTTYSAIHSRLHESQKKALAILHRINATFLPPANPQAPQAISADDFAGSVDVIPVSDPTIFSEAQRFAQTQAILQMMADQSVQWNKYAAYRRALKQMRVDNPDELLPPPPQPVTADTASENSAAMQGQQIRANPQQDHMNHIWGHLTFVASPLQAQNPLVPPPPINMLLGHINEHIQMLEQQMTMQVAQQMMQEIQMAGLQKSPDEVLTGAIRKVQEVLGQQLQGVLQQVAQVQETVKQRTPPPQMPPEVQATLQIAQAETQRKTQYDQGMMQIKQQELQGEQALAAQNAQLEQQAQQFEQVMARMAQEASTMMDAQRLQLEAQQQAIDERLRQMEMDIKSNTDLIKNTEDNHQKQTTEIVKNLQDNRTKEQIAANQVVADVTEQVGTMVDSLNEVASTVSDSLSPSALSEGESTLKGE